MNDSLLQVNIMWLADTKQVREEIFAMLSELEGKEFAAATAVYIHLKDIEKLINCLIVELEDINKGV